MLQNSLGHGLSFLAFLLYFMRNADTTAKSRRDAIAVKLLEQNLWSVHFNILCVLSESMKPVTAN